jgi:hypothetical protein
MLDGPGTDEETRTDLRIGQALTGQPRDLGLLWRQLWTGRDRGALAGGLPGGQEFTPGPLGEARIPITSNMSCAVCNCARASVRRRSRRNHSP